MRKEIVKFVTGTLVNVLMSIVILSLLGVQNAAAWGVAAGVVIPMALGKFMPEGAALEGVYTEVWTGELVKQLRGGMTASFLDGVSDYSAAVNNEVVHLVDVGGDPDVLINNTTYPIAAQELEDGDIALGLDKFQTKKTAVSDDQLFAISYDKMGSVIERHGDAITIAKFKKAAHALAPNSNTEKTPVVPTSGDLDNGRKKCTRKDIIALKRKLDALQVPTAGRRLVLCSDHCWKTTRSSATSITTTPPERLPICTASRCMNLRTVRTLPRKAQKFRSRTHLRAPTIRHPSASTPSVCSVRRVAPRCITATHRPTRTTSRTK